MTTSSKLNSLKPKDLSLSKQQTMPLLQLLKLLNNNSNQGRELFHYRSKLARSSQHQISLQISCLTCQIGLLKPTLSQITRSQLWLCTIKFTQSMLKELSTKCYLNSIKKMTRKTPQTLVMYVQLTSIEVEKPLQWALVIGSYKSMMLKEGSKSGTSKVMERESPPSVGTEVCWLPT